MHTFKKRSCDVVAPKLSVLLYLLAFTRGMQIAHSQRAHLVLLFLLTLICMPQVYACVPTCGKEFKKSFSLVQHKQSCAAALEMRKKSQKIRQNKGDDVFPKEASPFGRKERLQVRVVSIYYITYVKIRHILYLRRLQYGTHILRNR